MSNRQRTGLAAGLLTLSVSATIGLVACGNNDPSSPVKTTASQPQTRPGGGATNAADQFEPQGQAAVTICSVAASGKNITTGAQADALDDQLWSQYAVSGSGSVHGYIKQLHDWRESAHHHTDYDNDMYNQNKYVETAGWAATKITEWCNGLD